MSLFHRHQWTEVARRFYPPTARKFELSWATQEFVESLLVGVTVIELRCECGDVRERRLLGSRR